MSNVADSPSATCKFYYIPLHSKKAYQPSHRLVKFFYSPIKSYNILLIITIKREYNLPSDKLTELGVRKAKPSSKPKTPLHQSIDQRCPCS